MTGLLLALACARQAAPDAVEGVGGAARAPAAVASGASGAAVLRRVGDLGDHAFLTPRDAPATVALVAGGELPTTAATCGACHADHYAEWQGATHAAAITDLQYLAELAKPGQPRWLCLNCHAPTAPQRAEHITLDTPLVDAHRAVAATPNPDFDPARTAEGVTCATCHIRRDTDGAGTVVGPRGSGRAPHRVRRDPEALTNLCVECHSPGDVTISPTLTCWFDTAEELAAGPSAGTSCTECHMPAVERPAAAGGPVVSVRQHLWNGGGVPKTYDHYDGLLARGWSTGLDVGVTLSPPVVTLTNARAGHTLPTADPERHLRVEARLEDAAGAVLARDVLRVGQTWDWGEEATGRVATRLADNRLLPGESRLWSPALARAPGAARLVIEVAHVRVTPENASYMAKATLDAELTALWPAAPALLPAFDANYPLATWIWRGSYPLDGTPPTVATPEELVAASKALATAPLAEKASRLGIP